MKNTLKAKTQDLSSIQKPIPRKCLGELNNFLNKENFSDSSFSFNKSFTHEEDRENKREISNKPQIFLKNEGFFKRLGTSVEKMQEFLDLKVLDFQKIGFLSIYQKTDKVQRKLTKVSI